MNEDVYIFYQIKHGDVPASHVSVGVCIVYTFIDYNYNQTIHASLLLVPRLFFFTSPSVNILVMLVVRHSDWPSEPSPNSTWQQIHSRLFGTHRHPWLIDWYILPIHESVDFFVCFFLCFLN